MVSRGPTLTFFFIGLIVFVGVMILIYDPNWGLYNSFLTANGATPDNAYTQAFVNELNSSQNNMGTLAGSYQQSGWAGISSGAQGIVSGVWTTLVIGFDSMKSLSSLPTLFQNLFNSTSSILQIPAIIIWIVSTVLVVFLASKIIKALRGQIDDV
jgi:hypothetical protein